MLAASEKLRVLVIGTGSAGLLMAHGLKKVGIECTVFEADISPTARPRDWNFGIYWAQSPLSDCLPDDLVKRLEWAQVDDHKPSATDFVPIFNAETFERLSVMPAPYTLRLQRRRLLNVLSTGLDIRCGKRLERVSSEGGVVTATFMDGTVEMGNLLIGAEGAHSPTREFLVGAERAALIQSPIVGTICMTKLPAESSLKLKEIHDRFILSFHPKGYTSSFTLHDNVGRDDPAQWEWMIALSWSSPDNDDIPRKGPELVKNLKERAKDFGQPLRFCYESIPDDAPAWHNRLSMWPTQEFDDRNGTVTIARDAAHPMTYHRGQGLNNAILDAADFLQKLRGMKANTPDELSKAVKAYGVDLWPRGREAVLSSSENSLQIHDWAQLEKSPLFRLGARRDGEELAAATRLAST